MIQLSIHNSSGSVKEPTVSLVMPVFNEEDFIEQSLRALARQTYRHSNMEIIVADGRSTDQTRALVSAFARTSPISIILIDNPERIAPTGLNRSIAVSKGEIIIRVDGHCEIDACYVANCVQKLRDGKAEGVGGPIETVGETRTARAIAAAMGSSFGVGGSAFRTVRNKEIYVDTVAFPGYKRDTLRMAGPFNEELVRNQDDEFNYRVRKLGGRILLSPDIRSRYFSRGTFRSLWRQYFQYGFWKVRVFQLHPAQMSLRQFVPSLFVVSVALSFIFGLFTRSGRAVLFLILFSYVFSAALASWSVAHKSKIGAVHYVFISFAILHVSYGLGFLKGLGKFWRRWRLPQRIS